MPEFRHATVVCGPDYHSRIEQSKCAHCGWLAYGTQVALAIAEQAHICFAAFGRKASQPADLKQFPLRKSS
jgi:hypothetical protein